MALPLTRDVIKIFAFLLRPLIKF